MNNATAKVLFLIAAALGGPYAGQQVLNPPVIETPAVEAPAEAEVGELVHLRHPGSRVEWLLDTEDYVVVGPGEIAASFRKPGRHEVIVSAIVNGRLTVDKVYIEVGRRTPDTVEPDTVEPDTVEPDDTPKSDLSQKVYNWCQEFEADKASARQLYENFTEAASTSEGVTRLVAKTARLNAGVEDEGCRKVLGKIQLYLLQNLGGKTFVDHQCAWDEIAQGFLHWSE